MLRRKNAKNDIMSVWQLETSIDRIKAYEPRFHAKVAIYEKGVYIYIYGLRTSCHRVKRNWRPMER